MHPHALVDRSAGTWRHDPRSLSALARQGGKGAPFEHGTSGRVRHRPEPAGTNGVVPICGPVMNTGRNKDRSGVKAGLKDAAASPFGGGPGHDLLARTGTSPVRVSVWRVAVSDSSAAIPPTV